MFAPTDGMKAADGSRLQNTRPPNQKHSRHRPGENQTCRRTVWFICGFICFPTLIIVTIGKSWCLTSKDEAEEEGKGGNSAEKQKQQMCLGSLYALLIKAKIAKISLQAQPYYRESCQIMKNKSRRQADSLQQQCPKATNQTTPNLDPDLRLH